MKTKLYVDWMNRTILTKEELEDLIQNMIEDSIARDENYMTFAEFLERYYTHIEIFEFTEIERDNALYEYEQRWGTEAENLVLSDYDVVEVDL